jgi:hypothetical protein
VASFVMPGSHVQIRWRKSSPVEIDITQLRKRGRTW